MLRERFEFPPAQRESLRRARRLEWVTLASLVGVVVVMYLTMGNSQAMRTAWLEDLISFVPPVVFLACSRVQERGPNRRFPFGYLRVMTIAFAVASASLIVLGAYMLADAGVKLMRADHPSIGGVVVAGRTVWLGWVMIGALAVTSVPPVILGRLKLRAAHELHDKTLHADAAMNRADWTTGLAGIVGIVGIAAGWWWADGAAAAFISLGILRDGWRHLKRSLSDACDQRPTPVDADGPDPLIRRVRETVAAHPGVREVTVRFCCEGVAISGDVFVVLDSDDDAGERLRDIEDAARGVHWRLHCVRARQVREISDRFL